MRIALMPALLAALGGSSIWMSSALAADVGDLLSPLPIVASADVAFTSGVPLVTRESLGLLRALLAQARPPSCYWLAQGRNLAQAEALRVALGELDIAVERVLPLVREEEPAQARIYCTAPALIVIAFEQGAPTLMPEAEETLPLAVASYAGSAQKLTVRGFSSTRETAETLKLGLDRAQAARDFLIDAGLPPERMTIESKVENEDSAVPRVEIAPSP
jgi:outer membrane protein OmpA-like peptidoglycan-associated protein